MAGFKCPFCQQIMSLNSGTFKKKTFNFDENYDFWMVPNSSAPMGTIQICMYKCPNCNKITIKAIGESDELKGLEVNIYPLSNFVNYPEYIPESVRKDYEEACSIVNLSPKASATLARRCLQGMIRDFWQISKNRLIDEIEAIKDKIPIDQWKVIDSLRKLGNIGAHMEKDINVIVDIDPGEAEKLIKLIEMLINDWYINRYNQQELYKDILNIDSKKQLQKAGNVE